jgi:O-methyltransferase
MFISKVLNYFITTFRKDDLETLAVPDRYPDFPIEANSFHRAAISNASHYSMTPTSRMWALIQSVEHVVKNKISGDFVECGVWMGGNLILLSAAQDYLGMSREIYGFDTFTGMVEPRNIDLDFRGESAIQMMATTPKIDGEHSIHAFASLDLVKSNLVKNNSKNIKLVQGDVSETLLNIENLPKKISILRLDTDWYESTKIELEVLYPLLEPGGVLIIDDYGHYSGARKAVDEYFANENPWMHYIDYSCRLIIKE